jgi:hypothetical protein
MKNLPLSATNFVYIYNRDSFGETVSKFFDK